MSPALTYLDRNSKLFIVSINLGVGCRVSGVGKIHLPCLPCLLVSPASPAPLSPPAPAHGHLCPNTIAHSHIAVFTLVRTLCCCTFFPASKMLALYCPNVTAYSHTCKSLTTLHSFLIGRTILDTFNVLHHCRIIAQVQLEHDGNISQNRADGDIHHAEAIAEHIGLRCKNRI